MGLVGVIAAVECTVVRVGQKGVGKCYSSC